MAENVLVHPNSYKPSPPPRHLQSIKAANDAMSNLDSILGLLDNKVPGLLHQGYGYILLVVFATYMVAFVQGFLVGKAREKYKVELPTMYSDTEQMFNCYQRVHQNTLERIPLFLAILLLAGLFNSIIAAVIGAIWVAGRVIYSVGYYSGVPNNRIVGSLVSQFCQQGKSVACKYNETKNKSIFQCLYFQVFHTCDQIFMWHFRRN